MKENDNKCKYCGEVNKIVTYRDVYTLTQKFTNGGKTDYTQTYDGIEDGDITWSVNGNLQASPWKFGGKTVATFDRFLASTTPFNGVVDRVIITLGTISIGKNMTYNVNSITFGVYHTDPTVANAVAIHSETYDWEEGKVITIDRPANEKWENCYFKITFNMTVSGKGDKNCSCTLGGFVLQVAE